MDQHKKAALSASLADSGISRKYRVDVFCVEIAADLEVFAHKAMAYVVAHLYRFDCADTDPEMAARIREETLDLEAILRHEFTGELPPRENDAFGKRELHEAAVLLKTHGDAELYEEFVKELCRFYASAYKEQTVREDAGVLLGDADASVSGAESWRRFWAIKRHSSAVLVCMLVNCLGSPAALARTMAARQTVAHPLARSMIELTNRIVCSHNDLGSIEREKAQNDPMNSVLLLTKLGHDMNSAVSLVVDFANSWVDELVSIGNALARIVASEDVAASASASQGEVSVAAAMYRFWEICWTSVSGNVTFTVMNAKRYAIPTNVSLTPTSLEDARLMPIRNANAFRLLEESLLERLDVQGPPGKRSKEKTPFLIMDALPRFEEPPAKKKKVRFQDPLARFKEPSAKKEDGRPLLKVDATEATAKTHKEHQKTPPFILDSSPTFSAAAEQPTKTPTGVLRSPTFSAAAEPTKTPTFILDSSPTCSHAAEPTRTPTGVLKSLVFSDASEPMKTPTGVLKSPTVSDASEPMKTPTGVLKSPTVSDAAGSTRTPIGVLKSPTVSDAAESTRMPTGVLKSPTLCHAAELTKTPIGNLKSTRKTRRPSAFDPEMPFLSLNCTKEPPSVQPLPPPAATKMLPSAYEWLVFVACTSLVLAGGTSLIAS